MGNRWIDSKEALEHNRLVQYSDWRTIRYSDRSVQKWIATVPKGAVILEYAIQTITTFNSGGTDLFTLGIYGDDDLYINDLDISAFAATSPTTMTRAVVNVRMAADTDVYGMYADGNTSATEGEMRVAIMWAPWAEQGT